MSRLPELFRGKCMRVVLVFVMAVVIVDVLVTIFVKVLTLKKNANVTKQILRIK